VSGSHMSGSHMALSGEEELLDGDDSFVFRVDSQAGGDAGTGGQVGGFFQN